MEQPASRKSRPVREWIGGRVPAPFFVQDCDEPYRPDIVVWMELPDHLVVGQAVLDPDDNHRTVARILRNAILNPNVGEPRQPDAIRVADHDLANEVRAEVAGTIPVTVAPTPELDELFQILIASMPVPGEDEPSYFAHGRVCPDAVELLFTASGFPLRRHPLGHRRRQPAPAHGHPRVRHRRRLPVDHRTAKPEPRRADLSLA